MEEAAIERRLKDFIATYESGDAAGTTAFYEDKAVMMAMGERAAMGKDEIKTQNEKTFSVAKQQTLNYRVQEVKQISPDMAFTRSECEPQDSDGKIAGKFQDLILWKKVEDNWFVFREINTLRG